MKEIIRSDTSRTYNKNPARPRYIVRDIFLNPDHVQLIRTNEQIKHHLNEAQDSTLKSTREFCTISLTNQSGDIVVIGSVEEVREQLIGGRRLLNG